MDADKIKYVSENFNKKTPSYYLSHVHSIHVQEKVFDAENPEW